MSVSLSGARSGRRLLQLVEIELADFGHLGRDHRAAVALGGVAAEVVAMVLLRRVERPERLELGHNRIVPHLAGPKLGHDALRRRLLLGRMVENRRAVLRAHVAALTVQRRRVVNREEHVQQLVERHDGGIEADLHDLGVTGGAGAHVLVRRVGHTTPRIAGLDLLHALQLLERGFEAPEAPAGEGRDFALWHRLFPGGVIRKLAHPARSFRAASAVPATRERILANAVSRSVEVSSEKGAKPQSSVVPSRSSGMYSAASSTRSRTCSGVSTVGSIGSITPMKIR